MLATVMKIAFAKLKSTVTNYHDYNVSFTNTFSHNLKNSCDGACSNVFSFCKKVLNKVVPK